jgi:glycoprotein endo-alpha-1,2-mannosidase
MIPRTLGYGRAILVLLAMCAAAAAAVPGADARAHDPEGPPAVEVAVFYYPWYGTPARDGRYHHWGQNGHDPPVRIASEYFPARGVYSSSSPVLLQEHMADLVAANATTVVVSWWGPGSVEDARLGAVASTARRHGLRVAVHVEPFAGRSPGELLAEVERLRPLGITDLYVYEPSLSPDEEWRLFNEGVSDLRVFAHTSLPGRAAAGGFDGLYTYDVLSLDGSSFGRMCRAARELDLLCAPSVGPGFDARRATGDGRVRPRNRGETYDRMWQLAIAADPDLVTITSYNEWHEGTQIEPAQRTRDYRCYDGHWGLRGSAAEAAYLRQTARWVERYAERRAQYSAAASLRR